ncbi:MAG: nuclear transport factor 2 family protein [Terriglobales bacterium]
MRTSPRPHNEATCTCPEQSGRALPPSKFRPQADQSENVQKRAAVLPRPSSIFGSRESRRLHCGQNRRGATLQSTLLASDFVHVLPEGFLSRQQQLQYLRSHPDTFHGTRRFARLQVRVYGDVAIATGIVLSSPTQGRATRSLFTDVFVLRHGRWLVVNSQENAATTG